jgi:OmpA-OmpF porin, OOP family
MDLLGLIKEKLTDTVVDKISGFLGEHPDKINSALNSAVPTVLGGIMQKANTPEEAGKVMDILKDGGHSGEILDDLSGLLGHFDKTQMLITIGSNIANHFFGDKTNTINETLSTVSGIRKTSASSLIGLSTPLVLGAIGKVVAKEGLGVAGLSKLLGDQKEAVQKALPPALFNLLDIKNPVITPVATEEIKPKIEVKPKKSNFNTWIPWILLILLALGALAWVKGFKNYFFKHSKASDSISVSLPQPQIKVDSTTFGSSTKIDSTTNTFSDKNATENPNENAKTSAPIHTTETASPKNEVVGGALGDKLDGSSESWVGLENVTFKKNSAEMVKKGNLDDLVKYLKNHSKAKVKIGGYKDGDKRLSEDRSYSVREMLIENGIGEGRIQIASEPIGEATDMKVAAKIIKK